MCPTSEQTPISRKNTKQKETGFFMFFPKIFQTKPHKMQKQADKTQKKQHHSDSNQKYIAETQYFAEKIKKNFTQRDTISKKYYLCHRKNDETFIETMPI